MNANQSMEIMANDWFIMTDGQLRWMKFVGRRTLVILQRYWLCEMCNKMITKTKFEMVQLYPLANQVT